MKLSPLDRAKELRRRNDSNEGFDGMILSNSRRIQLVQNLEMLSLSLAATTNPSRWK